MQRTVWNFFGVVYIKTCELNCLNFASIVYHITVAQRRLDSGLQSIMVNERLITRGFSLTCWLSRREHLWEKEDGAFERVGLWIIRQNSLNTYTVVIRTTIFVLLSCMGNLPPLVCHLSFVINRSDLKDLYIPNSEALFRICPDLNLHASSLYM